MDDWLQLVHSRQRDRRREEGHRIKRDCMTLASSQQNRWANQGWPRLGCEFAALVLHEGDALRLDRELESVLAVLDDQGHELNW